MTRKANRLHGAAGGEASYGAADFKAHCLEVMDKVAKTGRSVTVTKRGKPIVRVVPVPSVEEPQSIFGRGKGLITSMGDIVSPTGERWDAER